jgi:hypothetical protein
MRWPLATVFLPPRLACIRPAVTSSKIRDPPSKALKAPAPRGMVGGGDRRCLKPSTSIVADVRDDLDIPVKHNVRTAAQRHGASIGWNDVGKTVLVRGSLEGGTRLHIDGD